MNPALIDWLAEVSDDPYAFALGAFPWGEPETRLANFDGPNEWQTKTLCLMRDALQSGASRQQAIQLATASGHGVGKSALVSMVILWAMSTSPNTRGVVTANTETQLKTKTWVELGKWFSMFIAKDLFTLTATQLFAKSDANDWRFDMVPWSERNTEAFAGLHNQGRRILVIFDEASAIPDVIWETTEGALTDADTEILWLVFGNPTRNTGRFRECFPGQRFAPYWQTQQIDSRSVPFTNKEQIRRWIEAYGADSDFVRIRVLGVFPRSGEMEFFNAAEIDEAMAREATSSPTDPLAVGVDVARYGANNSVIFFRKGRDARSIPRQSFNGLSTVEVAQKVFDSYSQYRSDGIFIDGGGVGGGVVDNCRNLHLHVFEILFQSKASGGGYTVGIEGEKYANKRAEMYGCARAWIKVGALPNDPELRKQLLAITYTFNLRDEIQLIRKEDMIRDGLPSPDDADAFVLTFALPLNSHSRAGGQDFPLGPLVVSEYNPFDEQHMAA